MSAALIICHTGKTHVRGCRSNRGFDELVPHHIHVVDETRVYQEATDVAAGEAARGITAAKRVFNDLHAWMSKEGFSQLFVDQMSEDVVGVTRHCPQDHRSVVTVVSTAFHPAVKYNQSVYMLQYTQSCSR